MSKLTSKWMLLVLALATVVASYAQAPSGTLLGTVRDESGAIIPNASITLTNKANGSTRTATTNSEGLYVAPALQPGDYEVRVEMQGFRTLVRPATVTAGGNTTVDIAMVLGESKTIVNVEAAAAQINYESHTIQGVIDRATIEDLPLNGRSALQLASLEPGVTIQAGSTSQFNAIVNISVGGDNAGATAGSGVGIRMTVDGGTINDEMEGGGSMNLSQEVIQEFQLQQYNFDLSTGIGASGAVNIVTRSGGNQFHGSGYFFYRDHNMAAYPLLQRNPLFPDPFFARRNPGFLLGGPIKKDKLFFFFNYEYLNQTSVVLVQQDLPSLQNLSGAFPTPYHYNLINTRFDYHLSQNNTLFARYTHDGNFGVGPYYGSPLPSANNTNQNWSDQSIIGWTSVITPALVNDVRFQYHYWENNVLDVTSANCPNCVGLGLPSILAAIPSGTFVGGTNVNSPQLRQARAYELIDNLSWQKGSHQLKFGIDYEHMKTKVAPWDYCNPGCDYVFAPETVEGLGLGAATQNALFPNLPTQVNTTQDLLNLPVLNLGQSIYSGTGVGNGTFPGLYEHGQGGTNQRLHPYFQDIWKVRPNLTINFGLAYDLETGLFYSNLALPQYLSPILEGQTGGEPYGLGATQPNKKDFSPAFGFAWALGKDKKTVIRGGGGIYWDTQPIWQHFREGSSIGPPGDGRSTLAASAFTNTIPGILQLGCASAPVCPVSVGEAMPLGALTTMTLGQFISVVNQELPGITQQLAPIPQASGPYAVSGIDLAKQGIEIYPSHFPLLRSYQTSIGVQRDLGHNMVLTVDWARRQGENTNLGEVDVNHFTRYINGVQTPVIPICSPSQNFVPGQECSTGAITMWTPEGRSVYDGLLVKLNKRLSNHFQFVASYALQKSLAEDASQNPLNFFAGYGPVPGLGRQNLNIAGTVLLPWGFSLAINSSIQTRGPQTAYITGDILGTGDSNGAGTAISTLVPGLQFNCFGYSCGKQALTNAVATYNATYAGKTAPDGTVNPYAYVPKDFQFGDPTISQDFRLTKTFTYKERNKLAIFGEVFNAFNIANLQYTSFNLGTSSAPNSPPASNQYGQPSNRTANIFGSGGPRSFQVGARISF
jgi:hypothetical protein